MEESLRRSIDKNIIDYLEEKRKKGEYFNSIYPILGRAFFMNTLDYYDYSFLIQHIDNYETQDKLLEIVYELNELALDNTYSIPDLTERFNKFVNTINELRKSIDRCSLFFLETVMQEDVVIDTIIVDGVPLTSTEFTQYLLNYIKDLKKGKNVPQDMMTKQLIIVYIVENHLRDHFTVPKPLYSYSISRIIKTLYRNKLNIDYDFNTIIRYIYDTCSQHL